MVKRLSAMQETPVRFLGWEDLLEKGKATHSQYSGLENFMDYSLPGSSAHGVSQARILEWVATFFSRASSLPRDQTWGSYLAGGFFTTGPPGKPKLG